LIGSTGYIVSLLKVADDLHNFLFQREESKSASEPIWIDFELIYKDRLVRAGEPF
jgi:hypothetical protein